MATPLAGALPEAAASPVDAPPGVPAPAAGGVLAPLLAPFGAALRLPAFRLLWLSLLPGTLGIMMGQVAFGFVAYQLSGSTTTLALVTAGWGVSMFVLSPIAGETADRFPRRNVLLLAQGLLGVTGIIACALLLTGLIQVWHLLAIALIQGIAFAFQIPARQSLIAELVPPHDLANALALYNAGLNFNRVAGPAIGGALITLPAIGAGGVFGIMAFLYLLVLLMLQRLPATRVVPAAITTTSTGQDAYASTPGPEADRLSPAHVGAHARRRRRARVRDLAGSLRHAGDGIAYVASQPALRPLMLLAFLPVMFATPYQSLMPAIAARVFGTDAAGLGALLTANGLGALAGSLLLAALTAHIPLPRLQLASGLLLGGGLCLFALCPGLAPALACVALVGGASAAYTAANNTLLLSTAPPAVHGRVMGVYMMTVAATPLATLPVGWAGDLVGLAPTLVACGLVAAACVAVIGRSAAARRPVTA